MTKHATTFSEPLPFADSPTRSLNLRIRVGPLAAAIGLLVLGAGCGTQSETARGYDTAQEIVAKVEGTSGVPPFEDSDADETLAFQVAGDSCERTITTDEYGFELEKLECSDQQANDSRGSQPPLSDSGSPAASTSPKSSTTASTTATSRLNDSTQDSSQTKAALPSGSQPDTESPTAAATSDSPRNQISGAVRPTSPGPDVTKPGVVEEILAHQGFLPTSYFPSLAATVPTEQLRADFFTLGARLDAVDTHCGNSVSQWLTALEKVTRTAVDLTERTAASSFAGSPEAKALARSLVERGLHESGCSTPGAAALPSSKGRATLRQTKTTTEAVVALDNALRNSVNGPLFHQYSTYPNYLWLRNETTPTDVLLVGSSQVGAGLDVQALNKQFDREFGSVQLPGGLAEVQQWWIPEVTKFVNPSTIVWFLGPLDLFTGCEVGGRKAQYVANYQARSKTFDRSGWLRNYDPLDRIIGQPTPEKTVRGDAPKRPGLDSEGLETQRAQYVGDFNNFCTKRAEIVKQEVKQLSSENRRVIVVAMPVNPELTKARQGGLSSVTKVMNSFARKYLAGAEFIDLTATMQTSEPWSDLTHLTQPGSVQFTGHVIDHLYAKGIR